MSIRIQYPSFCCESDAAHDIQHLDCSKNLRKDYNYLGLTGDSSDRFNREILGPYRLINPVTPGADSILQLHFPTGELRDRLDLDKRGVQDLGHPLLEEVWVKQNLGVVFVQYLEHGGDEIGHGVVVLEFGRAVARPYLVPYSLGVGSAGADEPL